MFGCSVLISCIFSFPYSKEYLSRKWNHGCGVSFSVPICSSFIFHPLIPYATPMTPLPCSTSKTPSLFMKILIILIFVIMVIQRRQHGKMGEIVALGLESPATPSQFTSLSSTSAAMAFTAISIQTVRFSIFLIFTHSTLLSMIFIHLICHLSLVGL